MKRQPHPVCNAPLWVRWTALWCVLLCFGVALVQASHNHGPAGKVSHGCLVSALSDAGGEPGLCPFCAGMHLCPPSPGAALALGRPERTPEPKVDAIAVANAPLPYELSSRPPPPDLQIA